MPTLEWANREAAVRAATRAPFRLLEHDVALSAGDPDNENMLIQGDNLEAVKALMPYFAGRVKCIAIDPPYNTRSAFDHYDDNLEHSTWLSMMYPRLELMRDLLAEEGSIWVCIDDNEAHYLKVIMDQVFGRKNFVANVVWQKVYSERMDATAFSADHDHILVYRKSEQFSPGKVFREQNKKQFGYLDEAVNKYYRRRSLRKEGSESRREDRPSMWYAIKAPDGTDVYPIKPDGVEGRWRWKQENVSKNASLLVFVKVQGKWEIYVKQYLEDNPSRPPSTLWQQEEVGHNHEAKLEVRAFNNADVFGTPKPERLLQRILTIATTPGDIVCDPFLGSGTTAAVAHKMGRRWIGIEMGEHAVTHCAPRLQKVIEGEQGGISEAVKWKGGSGFRFYRLGPAITDDAGRINPTIRFPTLAAHVWFSETHTPLTKAGKSPLLGVHKGTAVYLLYNGILGDKKSNALTGRVLRALPRHDGPRVIFSECTSLGDDLLRRENIIFKHIPYDIKGR